MTPNLTKLRNLLAELFMFEFAELDFGIYRIMNAKRSEIQRFLDHDLLPQVQTELSKVSSDDRAELEAELAKSIQQAEALGADPDTLPKVKQLRDRLASTYNPNTLDDEVFSLLATFFRRYYKDGDYLALRRYKKDVYALPYEGEEVKLHWANADQYYIKSSEYFRDYAFKLPDGRRVHFKLTEADSEQNNNKAATGKERRFVLWDGEMAERGGGGMHEVDGDLVIHFAYRPEAEKQATLNKAAAAKILALAKARCPTWLEGLQTKAPTEKDAGRTLLEKHLGDYTARNSFDYFIHKNLRGFLRRELDFFIKSEVMLLDDIEDATAPRVEQYLAKVRAMRRIAHKIIDMLAQLEEFQKKLWLKKKFVVATNYCVTLDRVPEALYPAIAANAAQREEWVRLFAIDDISGDLIAPAYSVPLTLEFLKAHPFLVLDTRFFAPDFKARLLASFDDLDAQLDGLLIHSENFQALNLMQERYREQVQCIYIDPPYNTDEDEFMYKDQYKESSWISLMNDRLILAKKILNQDGILFISIDDRELYHLKLLLDNILEEFSFKSIAVKMSEPTGLKMASVVRSGGIPKLKEYVLVYKKGAIRGINIERIPKQSWDSEYKTILINISREDLIYIKTVRDDKNRTPEDIAMVDNILRRIDFQSIIDHCKAEKIKITDEWLFKNAWRIVQIASFSGGAKSLADQKQIKVQGSAFSVITPQGSMYFIKSNYDSAVESPRIKILFAEDYLTVHPGDFWSDIKTTGLDNEGYVEFLNGKKPKKLVRRLISSIGTKKTDFVMDFFAGSGTTGEVAIELSLEDGSPRRYILCEMGDYFETKLLVRLKNTVFRNKVAHHLLKYIRLESYEDALNNLEMQRSDLQTELLEELPALREDYMLRYMLDVESRGSTSLLNIAAFAHPFDYTLKIATGSVGETRPMSVDLVETFNYLLGLRVHQITTMDNLVTVVGVNAEGQRVLIIWRDVAKVPNNDLDTFFQTQGYSTREQKFDLIYVNGDNTIENIRRDDETWKVRLTEQEFQRLMFDVRDV